MGSWWLFETRGVLGAEVAVSGIAQAWNDEGLSVECWVNGGSEDGDLWVG